MKNSSVSPTTPDIFIQRNMVWSVIRGINYADFDDSYDMATVPMRNIHTKQTHNLTTILAEGM
jgi:hypothetical protein